MSRLTRERDGARGPGSSWAASGSGKVSSRRVAARGGNHGHGILPPTLRPQADVPSPLVPPLYKTHQLQLLLQNLDCISFAAILSQFARLVLEASSAGVRCRARVCNCVRNTALARFTPLRSGLALLASWLEVGSFRDPAGRGLELNWSLRPLGTAEASLGSAAESGGMSPGVVVQVVQGVSVLAGAWMVKSILDAEEQKPMVGGRQCATCNGTRKVPCMCTRWSDNDVGCSSCSGSGKMTCSSCGGSGTGRPIPVQIRASSIPGNGRS